MAKMLNNEHTDGYYISLYCDIDSLGNILDSELRHDQNITLWYLEKNELTLMHHWELERLTGLKHHHTSFFSQLDFINFLNQLLLPYGLTDHDIIEYIGGIDIPRASKIYFRNDIAYHTLCHLYSSMCIDSEIFHHEKILALSVDAEPDRVFEANARNKFYFSAAFSDHGVVDIFPISSPGILWTAAAHEFRMPEGSLMALASASKSCSYITYKMPDKIMTHHENLASQLVFRNLITNIFSYEIKDQGVKFNFFDNRFTEKENKISMIIKILQDWSILLIDQIIDAAIQKYCIIPRDTNIALSGGYFLNCPTNTHIMQKYGFKRQLITPCVNDSGQAIGAGLLYFYKRVKYINFQFVDCYLGNDCQSHTPEFDYYIESVTNGFEHFVDDISKNPIIWFSGRAEIGPRALGHRSILADPRVLTSKNKLNKIKQREWWRPVAPIIITSECSQWFEESFPSPYMLNNFKIRKKKRKYVPSILHLDDTCRVQTISDPESLLYKALILFFKSTGVPILCNTSLNDKGEPIIDNLDQAINFALRKKIEVIYFNGTRYHLTNFDKYQDTDPLKRNSKLFESYRENEAIYNALNPFGITMEEYAAFKNSNSEIELNYQNEKDMIKFKRIIKKMIHVYNVSIGNIDKLNI